GQPVVPERDPGQIEPLLGGEHHAGKSGERQVATQHPVRSTTAQGREELLRARHPMTVTHRPVSVGYVIDKTPRPGSSDRTGTSTTLSGYVWDRRLCGGAQRPRPRGRRAAPDSS